MWRGGRKMTLKFSSIPLVLALIAGLGALTCPAAAETPREKKQAESSGSTERPRFAPSSSGASQQQERQDRARPAPVRERTKPGESQQDARKRRDKDKALGN